MYIGRNSNWYNPYYITACGKYCNNILFHNGEKVICEVGRGWFDYYNVDGITLCGINDLGKAVNFSSSDKRNASIEKHIKNKEFFYILNPKEYGEVTCDLYLYVDGERIKEIENREYIEDWKSEYDLSYNKYTHKVYKFDIDGIEVEVDNRIGKVEVDTAELSKKADELERLFKDNSIFISKSDVCKILNSFNVELRNERLLDNLV